MKKVNLLLILTMFCGLLVDGQVIKRIGDRVKRKVENKAGDKIEKSIDESLDGKKKTEKKDSTSDEEKDDPADDVKVPTNKKEKSLSDDNTESLAVYSKYDFVPGERVIAYEDFSNAEIGDFPTRWNTNATGEVVKINAREGKWLKVHQDGVFHPEFITGLPENFTLEFDLGVNDGWNSNAFNLNITKLKSPEEFSDYGHYVKWQGDHTVHLQFRPAIKDVTAGNSKIIVGKSGNHTINNDVAFTSWNNSKTLFGHISIWRQNQRLRVYMNGQKIWDLPKAFEQGASYNAVTVGVRGSYKEKDYFLLNNIRLASGIPDTRNKLITEGRFVTNGILFDVNSDVIKAESYGALKDIAKVLSENTNVKIKIIGHTDSDGETQQNEELSKRRAVAVKKLLSSEFDIDENRMSTDGKGESQPVDKNDSPVGKANNRRVEFVKI